MEVSPLPNAKVSVQVIEVPSSWVSGLRADKSQAIGNKTSHRLAPAATY